MTLRLRGRAIAALACTGLLATTACTGTNDVPPAARPAGSPSAPVTGSAAGQVASYVALGDSYTAAPLVPVTDVADGCFRSSANYPSLVAARLRPALFTDRSCSGAQTTSMTTPQGSGIPPQLDALRPDTELVTVGIGGNDGKVFASLVGYCTGLRARSPDGAPCRRFFESPGPDRLLTAIASTQAKLVRLVAAIKKRSPTARVLLVGYPRLVPDRGTCPKVLPLTAGDYRYALQIGRALNHAVRVAAMRSAASYVDVERASRGHDLCSAHPWVNGPVSDQSRAEAFHPFAVEQAAVARLVEKAVGIGSGGAGSS